MSKELQDMVFKRIKEQTKVLLKVVIAISETNWHYYNWSSLREQLEKILELFDKK